MQAGMSPALCPRVNVFISHAIDAIQGQNDLSQVVGARAVTFLSHGSRLDTYSIMSIISWRSIAVQCYCSSSMCLNVHGNRFAGIPLFEDEGIIIGSDHTPNSDSVCLLSSRALCDWYSWREVSIMSRTRGRVILIVHVPIFLLDLRGSNVTIRQYYCHRTDFELQCYPTKSSSRDVRNCRVP